MKWEPLTQASIEPLSEEQIVALAQSFGAPVEEIRKEAEAKAGSCFKNSIYTVFVREQIPNDPGMPVLVHLSIKRNDRAPIHDWRHLQQIKNELVGPECEGIEMYPAESRVVDTANQYHLWVFKDPSFRLPLGFATGKKLNADEVQQEITNVKQRKL
jgi:hypothetical protein